VFPHWQPSAPQIVYYDGQMDDARINVALATTAAMAGAAVANHVRVTALTKARLGCQGSRPRSAARSRGRAARTHAAP
jgi:glycerol-3-phosphate dehydrogenase